MTHSNSKAARASGWRGLLALLLLALAATACTKGTSDIGVGLPTAQSNTGAYLIDTITVRSSTILRDSVVTSNSAYLLVGRANDPQLGTITATSAFRVGLPGAVSINSTFVFDSVTLVLNPDTYRYGDTTKTQSLVEVRQLTSPISDTKPSFASPKYTTLSYDASSAGVLNAGGVAPVRRARPNISSLRLPLSRAFGQNLLAQGQSGQLSTQDQLNAFLPGLVLTPTANDNAAIIRLSTTATTSGLFLYYHDPLDPTTVLNTGFTIVSGNRHFYQVTADRSTAGATPSQNFPTASLQTVSASLTGQQTFIEGSLGLQTKLEFPYLTNLLDFGTNLTITSANLTVPVPVTTLSTYVPVPPSLAVSTVNAANRPIATYVANVPYLSALSAVTGIEQGSYTWSVQSYIQAVLSNTVPNNGMLLAPALAAATATVPVTAPELPNRVILGSQRNTINKLQLRLYLIQVK